MSAWSGPLEVVALALVVSGILKLIDPEPAGAAMRTAGLPVGRLPAGRALGSVEIVVGAAPFALPGPPSAIGVALLYAAMTGFVVRLRARDAGAACGCIGRSSAPPTPAHVVANLAAIAIAVGATATGSADPLGILDQPVTVIVPHLVLVAVGTVLVLIGPALVAGRDPRVLAAAPRGFGTAR